MKNVRRGQLWFYNNPDENFQRGNRPVIIVSNNVINATSSTLLVVPCTRQVKRNFPTHALFVSDGNVSVALAEQLHRVDVSCLTTLIMELDQSIMDQLDVAIMVALGLKRTKFDEELTENNNFTRRQEA